jgi:hypothetical protein
VTQRCAEEDPEKFIASVPGDDPVAWYAENRRRALD